MKTLKGGTFNLRFGRSPFTIRGEVERLLDKHNLDFLCVQEAASYRNTLLHNVDDYTYYTGSVDSDQAHRNTGVLVKDGLGSKHRVITAGDGWHAEGGGKRGPVVTHQVTVAGWCMVRSLHLPTPSEWYGGFIGGRTPSERKDDLIAAMKEERRFFTWPCVQYARVAAGDWNEPSTTVGLYTPRWLLNKTNAKVPTGLGESIDYPVGKGLRFTSCFKDNKIAEWSDHEPVVFSITKSVFNR